MFSRSKIATRPTPPRPQTAEHLRLSEEERRERDWKLWGPYLSERQWGTVREDYSEGGDAWGYFSYEMSLARAYRWGEDGIAGISDADQRLCLALALWNGHDPHLKERLFGLTNPEGNHGEDVKELYYYLDATPSHSYLKMLYKYPHAAFPYERLRGENQQRTRNETEFELADTGVFDQGRYFDVFVEYAKEDIDHVLMQITVFNRAEEEASLHLLPHLWFRNTWSWSKADVLPKLSLAKDGSIHAEDAGLGDLYLYAEGSPEPLFCDNETNGPKLYQSPPTTAHPKDSFHAYVVGGEKAAIRPDGWGTKAAFWTKMTLAPKGSHVFRLRLSPRPIHEPFRFFEATFQKRVEEADAFYEVLQKDITDPEAREIQRQAWAGMIWGKQFYHYDIQRWLDGDPLQPQPPKERKKGRNAEWNHLNSSDILTMPDKWEYPWFAAWDHAFHCLPLAQIDPAFAKEQLVLLVREWYMHPNGQIPAYEWNFSDVNPPVHAWATWRVFQIDRQQRGGDGDLDFLERVFHKLLLNFTWWVNRKDAEGRNLFQGGFLGLDNIGVFDRSSPLPTGGKINQADGTSWMAMFSLKMMRIALELALHNKVYEDIATKFFEHFLHIAKAMTNMADSGVGLWDDHDKFYYDVLHLPDGRSIPLKVRSMVGLIPLFAVETLEPEMLSRLPDFHHRMTWFLNYRPDLAALVSRWEEAGRGEIRLLSLLRGHRMKRLLKRMLDPREFLSDYGIRGLSRVHHETPYEFHFRGQSIKVAYEPAESSSGLFGGNSNWRGPIWFPVNFLLIEALREFHTYYSDDFLVEYPTHSGEHRTLRQIADALARRLLSIFRPDAKNRRPVFGQKDLFQTDPNFRDHLLFYEYFDGDTGRGLGASHQTGWTGLIASLLEPHLLLEAIR